MSSGFLTTGVFYWFNWIDPIGGVATVYKNLPKLPYIYS